MAWSLPLIQDPNGFKRFWLPVVSAYDFILRPPTAGQRTEGGTSVTRFAGINLLSVQALAITTPSLTTFLTCFTLVAVHWFSIMGALAIINEETDVWNGTLPRPILSASRRVKDVKVIATSTVFFLLFLSLLMLQWDALVPSYRIVDGAYPLPCKGQLCRYFQYGIALIYEMPGLGNAVSWLAPAKVQFHHPAAFVLGVVLWIAVILGIKDAFLSVYLQKKQMEDVIRGFGQPGADIDYLVNRVKFAPEDIQHALYERAKKEKPQIRRIYRRALKQAKLLGVFALVCLEDLEPKDAWENRRRLKEIRNLIKTDPQQFDDKRIGRMLDALKAKTDEQSFKRFSKVVREQLDAVLVAFVSMLLNKQWPIAEIELPRLQSIAADREHPLASSAKKLVQRITISNRILEVETSRPGLTLESILTGNALVPETV